ncbi:transposase [Micromonospora sp. NPDC023888]|uniref:transposase n=1 Tax=Micromonospora sp. NPDC023888 TaxID=3155607 RepID=UPI003406808F
MAVGHSVDPARWRVILDEAVTRVADRFVRAKPRATAGQFAQGLLSGVERKTCWSLAERAGHADPQAMQRLLRTAVWDADVVRDDVRDWLAEQIGHPGPQRTAAMIGRTDLPLVVKACASLSVFGYQWARPRPGTATKRNPRNPGGGILVTVNASY